MEQPSSEEPQETVRSPFAGTQSTIRKTRRKPASSAVLIGTVLACFAALAFGVYLSRGAFNNPLRTLRSFPVEEYYSNHSSLEGTRFKADFKILDQLGWKEDVGRLVTVAINEEKPVVIVVPQKFESIDFERGDHFEGELLVGQGGLIKANYLRKN